MMAAHSYWSQHQSKQNGKANAMAGTPLKITDGPAVLNGKAADAGAGTPLKITDGPVVLDEKANAVSGTPLKITDGPAVLLHHIRAEAI